MGDSVIATIAALSNFILVILILQVSRRAAPVKARTEARLRRSDFRKLTPRYLWPSSRSACSIVGVGMPGLSLSGGAAAAIAR